MKLQHFIPSFFRIILSIFIIHHVAQAQQNTGASVGSQQFDKSYQPATFNDDQRVSKIQSLAPEIYRLMEEYAKDKNIPGIAYGIVVDNQLVLDSATGMINLEEQLTASVHSSFRIASMTKSFTAMAIMKLREEGKISLEDPVVKYIPEMSSLEYLTADAPPIRIKNLLTMTAGFPEDNPWGDRQLNEPDAMLMNMMKEGVSFANPPAYAFEYSNTGFALLGHIVSKVSGMSYQDYIRKNILLPLGMTNTYWEYSEIPKNQLALGYRWEDDQWKLEPMLHDGSFGAMGGLITSIEDFSKYVSFHLSAWPPRNAADNGPVKRSSLREMQTPQFSRLYAKSTDWNDDTCAVISGYGFGLGISTNCRGYKRVSHGGALPGFGSNYVFYPEYGIGLMAFCNLTYTSPWPLDEIQKLLFETVDPQKRILPPSRILEKRQKEIVELIQHWDPNLEKNILAENFYLDKSREKRLSEIKEMMANAGAMEEVQKIVAVNQLRGTFDIKATHGIIHIFFTLTPEKDPKVQYLNIELEERGN